MRQRIAARQHLPLQSAHPLAHRLSCRTQLLGNRTDRLPLRTAPPLGLEDHPHRPLAHLHRVLPRPSLLCHGSIRSRGRACVRPGKVHTPRDMINPTDTSGPKTHVSAKPQQLVAGLSVDLQDADCPPDPVTPLRRQTQLHTPRHNHTSLISESPPKPTFPRRLNSSEWWFGFVS